MNLYVTPRTPLLSLLKRVLKDAPPIQATATGTSHPLGPELQVEKNRLPIILDPNAQRLSYLKQLDLEEGADALMVKPALAYLDVIARVRAASRLPLVAYNVSGEYSAVKAAAEAGWLDERRIVSENLHAIRRAGADIGRSS